MNPGCHECEYISSRSRCAIFIIPFGNGGQRIVAEFGYDALMLDVPTTAGTSTPTAGAGDQVAPTLIDGYQRLVTALRQQFKVVGTIMLEQQQFRNR